MLKQDLSFNNKYYNVEGKEPNEISFSTCPSSWYYLCSAKELPSNGSRPLLYNFMGGSLIAFKDSKGSAIVLNSRCAHMGSDLSISKVEDDCISCPFHGWKYASNGFCNHIPAQTEIPPWAKVSSYPVVERFGQYYFYFGPPPYPEFPFFPSNVDPEFLYGKTFTLESNCPWYIMGSNPFDIQHFKTSHDRVLIGDPKVSEEFETRVISLPIEINQDHYLDKILGYLTGKNYEFIFKSWRGTMLLVEARFKNSSSLGLVSLIPKGNRTTSFVETVILKKSGNKKLKNSFDFISLLARKFYIKRFVKSDVERIQGVGFDPIKTLDVDTEVKKYLYWVSQFKNNSIEG